jgi:hypothetical protein
MRLELIICTFIIPYSAMNGRDTNSDPSCGTDLANRLSWAFVVVTVTITERDKSINGKGAPIEVGA